MNKSLYAISLVIFFFSYLQSCVDGNDNKTIYKNLVKSTIESKEGTTLKLPFTTENDIAVNKTTIITYIDTQCGICKAHIDFWSEFINELKSLNCDVNILIYKKDDYFDDYFADKIGENAKYILDPKEEFITSNDILNSNFQAALIDKDQKVLLLGRPTYKPKLAELYKKVYLEKCNKQ